MPVVVKKSFIFLALLLFLLCGWAYNDVMSSAQAGLKEAERGTTHVFIFSLVVAHFLYVFFRNRRMETGVGVNLFLLSIFIWYAVVDLMMHRPFMVSMTMLMMAFWWILAYHFPYAFCKNNPQGANRFLGFYVLMFIAYVMLNLMARQQITTNYERDFAVTGFAYYLVIFVPYILLLRKSLVRTLLFGLSIVMIVTSFKRGCIVTLPVMLFIYGFVDAKINRRWHSFIINCLVVAVVAVAAFTIVDNASGGFLSERFSKEEMADGSGRAGNFQLAMDAISERSTLDLIFGSGHGSSVDLIGTGVHNEWLEFLLSFGVVGLALYFLLGVALMCECARYVRKRQAYAPHACMMMGYFYMVSLFSGFYGIYVTYYFFIFMGLVKYLNEREGNKRRLDVPLSVQPERE